MRNWKVYKMGYLKTEKFTKTIAFIQDLMHIPLLIL